MTDLRWDLHSIIVQGSSNDAAVRQRWKAAFGSRPLASDPHAPSSRLDKVAQAADAPADLHYLFEIVNRVPEPPQREPQFRQGDLLAYFVDGDDVVVHLPRYGQLGIDLSAGTTRGRMVAEALDTYGVFEDVLAVGLSPHLRRRDMFLIHAFAAARHGQAVLLVGGIGSGKTTTGMALLDAGWRLLSNDSPIITAEAHVLSYPGLLAAHPDTFARFSAAEQLANVVPTDGDKITVRAETIWPGVWVDQAVPEAIMFLQIEPRAEHSLEPLTQPEALRGLLPHAVEQWDQRMIGRHLQVLRSLVERAPAFRLRLGPNVPSIPDLLDQVLG
jgi:hypothetical protein